MELKYAGMVAVLNMAEGFNCTFMELKYYDRDIMTSSVYVLIVPLWN